MHGVISSITAGRALPVARRWPSYNPHAAAPLPSEAELLETISEAVRGLHGQGISFEGGAMADDLKQTGRADDQRINVEQDHELNYWSKELGVSREQLRSAVQQAGSLVRDVRRHLSR
jgi:hypothetical protein